MPLRILLYFFYIITNSFFLYKYAFRYEYFNLNLLIFIYVLFITLFFIFKEKIVKIISLGKYLPLFYFIGITFFSIFLCIVISKIDRDALNVDRWSAMDVAIKALTNREYPYTAVDHLGGRTSNLPGLLLIGTPFYFLGNVGYLQVFSFLFLSISLFFSVKTERAFLFLFFLVSSPAYWWEVLVLSDLMSNLILVFCFVLLIQKFYNNKKFTHPILLALIVSILALTRGIVFIPLILLLFKDFCYVSLKKSVVFLLSLFLFSFVLIFWVLRDCPNLTTLENFNPILLQTSTIPIFVILISFLFSFIFSFKVKDNQAFFLFSSLLMMLPVLYSFIVILINNGFFETLICSKADISYLSMFFPFVLFFLIQNKTNDVIFTN